MAAPSVILYSAQHEQMVNLLVKDFEKLSGVVVKVRHGEGPQLAAQLLKEGAASPADVYFTENSPELTLLEQKGMFAKVAPAALAEVPVRSSSPSGQWLGVLARENVLVYNSTLLDAKQLPVSMLDLAGPAWKGKIAIAPEDADFLPLVGAMLALKGHDVTLNWLKGMRDNAQMYDDSEGVAAAVNRGSVAVGILNSYYWARMHVQLGDKATRSALHHFGNSDVGALVNVSGAAVLKTAHNPEGAQQFLTYLVSERAQQLMAKSKVDFEYPLHPGIAADPLLKPLDQLSPPAVSIEMLGNAIEVPKLLRQAGLL